MTKTIFAILTTFQQKKTFQQKNLGLEKMGGGRENRQKESKGEKKKIKSFSAFLHSRMKPFMSEKMLFFLFFSLN
jgi:hypothetical protein